MSSSLDDHIRSALDRLRVTLSGQLEVELTASTADIVRAVDEEHRQAILDVTERTVAATRLAAEQQLSSAREEFERQRGDLERDKETLQQEKEDLRQGAASEIEGLERALSEARHELDAVRRELDDAQSARDALRLELEESRRAQESTTREQQDAIENVSREAEQTRLLADESARELQNVRARLAQIVRLTSAMRALDRATSLSEILDQLAQFARQESGRTAVFLVNGNRLRVWRALGFQDGEIVGSDVEPADAGVVGQAVRLGVSQQHRNGDTGRLPSFAVAGGPRDAIALPVQVGGSVIAVLYADAARADSPEDPEWLDTIEVMTKHAGRALEAMTVRQAAALWTPRHAASR